ncbi:MAG: DUF3945 domain-containing protein [Bacteroidales bacterium]
MAYSKKQNLEKNIEAIKLLFSLKNNQRIPNEIEATILKKYSGFGGIKCIINPIDKPETWTKSDLPLLPLVKELHEIIKTNTEGEKEYKQYFESLKNSIFTAYYTPKEVISSIVDVMHEQGIKVNQFLDPSAGNGAFVEAFKPLQKESGKSVAYEKDIITGQILSCLEPNAKVNVNGFESIENKHNNSFDVVASNIPFGDIPIFDFEYSKAKDTARKQSCKTIHNYFFLKSVDKARDGGLVAFITSEGVFSSPQNREVRKRLMEQCELVSVAQLPNNLFKDIANTEVSSHLIILQKNNFKNRILGRKDVAFIGVDGQKNQLQRLESIIHTKSYLDTDLYGKEATIYEHEGGIEGIAADLKIKLRKDFADNYIHQLYQRGLTTKENEVKQTQVAQKPVEKKSEAQNMQFDLFNQIETPQVAKEQKAPIVIQTHEYPTDLMQDWYRNNTLVEFNGVFGNLSEFNSENPVIFTPLAKKLNTNDSFKTRAYINIRDAYYTLYNWEASNLKESPELRSNLNTIYDDFIVKFDSLNDKKNVRLFNNDALFNDITSLEYLENGKYVKSDIFIEPVSFSKEIELNIQTAEDAMFASLNKYGKVNIEYMQQISFFSEQELTSELKGRIFYNPYINSFETADEFISGNVIKKAEDIEQWLQKNADASPEKIKITNESREALVKSIPTPIPFEELDFNLGERWMSSKIFADFASQLLKTNIEIEYNKLLDEFNVEAKGTSVEIYQKYAVKSEFRSYTGISILKHALHNTVPKISKSVPTVDGSDKKEIDVEKTQLFNTKSEQIREQFSLWLNAQSKEFKDDLVSQYNRKFNCFVKPKYNGEHQVFPDLNIKNLEKKYNIKEIYETQKNAVWMLKTNGGGIIDHSVGGGKSLTICIAAYEMKRLAIANKPMILGLKANVEEIAELYKTAYPNARVAFPSEKDFSKANRKKFINDIKNNNYDVVIMSHEQFGKLPEPLKIQERILSEELQTVEANLNVFEEDHEITNWMRKGMEKRKQNLEVKLENIAANIKYQKDDVVDFQQLGIDHIFVDESHQFKNLMFNTRHTNVAGLGNPDGSQKALNLLFALRTIQERTGRDLGATLLSGTTISNSLTELYSIFKYMRPNALEEQGINCFDAWAAIYAQKTTEYEVSVTGQIINKERFRHFIKVPELSMFLSEITDYKTADDIKLDRPKANEVLLSYEQTPDQKEFAKKLMKFAENGDKKVFGEDAKYLESKKATSKKGNQTAKMLLATNYARKMALDMRTINPNYQDTESSKTSLVAQDIADYYQRYNEHKGTQFVFTDLSTYKANEWNICSDIKHKLVQEYSIPESEIRFIQEAKTEKAKREIIKDMNEGKVRVLFGSTVKLGTGVNAQKRAVAVHHLDIPYRPSDLEQRDGRGQRKGNIVAKEFANNTIDIRIHAVKKTLDVYKFNLLKNKQTFISQIKNGMLGARRIDEGGMDENGGMNHAEYIAVLSGNTDLLDKAKLDKKIAALESEKKMFSQEKRGIELTMTSLTQRLQRSNAIVSNIKEDWANFQQRVQVGKDGEVLNPLRIDGATSEIESIGKKLNELKEKTNTGGEYQKIGELYGFEVVIKTERGVTDGGLDFLDNKFFVNGAYKYSHNNGRIAKDPKLAALSFMNALENIPKLIEKHQTESEQLSNEFNEIKTIASEEWNKNEELTQLKKEVNILSKKIALEVTNPKESLIDPSIKVPTMVGGIQLNEEQRTFLKEGKVVKIENMTDKQGRRLTAYVQVNRDENILEYHKSNPEENSFTKKMLEQTESKELKNMIENKVVFAKVKI